MSGEIVDSHFHLFEEGRRPAYRPGDLDEDVAAGGHAVTQVVHVECGQGYRARGPAHLRAVGETETVAALYGRSRGSGPDLAAIVGYADLSDPRLPEVLDAHEAAGGGRFRGIRQATAYDDDPAVPRLPQGPAPDLMARDEFRAGLAVLGGRGLSYDAYVYHPQLPQLAETARAVPDTTIVVNHLGSPLSIGSYAGRQDEVMAAWLDGIVELSECGNVAVKVGGLGMPMLGFGRGQLVTPIAGHQLAHAWHAVVSQVLAAFGPGRCLAESNFPVDRATCTYGAVWDAVKLLIEDLGRDDQRMVLADTARRLYRL
ncbi:amidohydrolase family protein [Nocardioides sp. WS12]|uniref:amidohydrolase family protein n=1 Tax=Nocardioides sp. WS12 TaxID=2486272 RepID=UPI0015FC24C9|nr:amidohydrolase family protein [Nocardioides sp. WS12]